MFDFSHRFFEQDKATTSSLRLDEAKLNPCLLVATAISLDAKPIGSIGPLVHKSDA
jgi:hypothetical protein